MNKEELKELVTIICNVGYDEKNKKKYSEKELDQLIELFEKSIPNSHGSDLIYYPEECGFSTDNPSIDEIVDKALQEE